VDSAAQSDCGILLLHVALVNMTTLATSFSDREKDRGRRQNSFFHVSDEPLPYGNFNFLGLLRLTQMSF